MRRVALSNSQPARSQNFQTEEGRTCQENDLQTFDVREQLVVEYGKAFDFEYLRETIRCSWFELQFWLLPNRVSAHPNKILIFEMVLDDFDYLKHMLRIVWEKKVVTVSKAEDKLQITLVVF